MDSLCLFFSNNYGALACDCCWKKKNKMTKLFDFTTESIDKTLDISKFMIQQRLTKHLIKKHLLTDEDLFRLRHAQMFCLDLDAPSSHDEDSDDELKQVKIKKAQLRQSIARQLSITNAQVA